MTTDSETRIIALTGAEGKYPHARPKGYIDWAPRQQTLTVLAQVRDVLRQYSEHLPLTIRQVFYRLVATCGYEKTERGYSRLCEYMNSARRARLIPFDAIRDDGWHQGEHTGFGGVDDFWGNVQYWAEDYALDKQARQSRWLAILVEAQGMRPQIERVAAPYSVPVFSSGGFDSLTAKKGLADRAAEQQRPCIFLHIGDYDPSGVCIFDAVAADVAAFCASDMAPAPTFERIAITPDQVSDLNLPTAPPKATDKRGAKMAATCQAEALPPDVLAVIVDDAIRANTDMAVLDADRLQEVADRTALLEKIRGL